MRAPPDPLEGVRLQRACEQAAFRAGGGEYQAPAQLVGDFLAQRPCTGPGRIEPTYPRGVTWSTIDDVPPPHVVDALREGIPLLDRKIRGYNLAWAWLTGVRAGAAAAAAVTHRHETSDLSEEPHA